MGRRRDREEGKENPEEENISEEGGLEEEEDTGSVCHSADWKMVYNYFC
jgi:hypothetical protein